MLSKGMKMQGGFKIFFRRPKVERLSLDLSWAVKNVECALRVGCGGGWSSQSQADLSWKIYAFIIWSLSKQWGILLLVISNSCLQWLDSYWEGLKLRKLVTNDWVHVSNRLIWGSGERMGAVMIAYIFWGETVVGKLKCEEMGWPSREEILYE